MGTTTKALAKTSSSHDGLQLATDNVDVDLWLEIAYEMAVEHKELDEDGKPLMPKATLDWMCEKFDLAHKEALGIVVHERFAEFLHQMQVAIAKVNFDRKAFKELDRQMTEGSDKTKLAAIKTAAELLDYKKSTGPMVNLQFNFDRTIRQIDSGEIIDAEVTEEEFPGF